LILSPPLRRDRPSSTFSDYFSHESFAVCWRRLQVLLDNAAPELALRYLAYLVSAVFGRENRGAGADHALRLWIQDATESRNSVAILVEMLLVLMLHQDEDRDTMEAAVRWVSARPAPALTSIFSS
jgi:hypothetical protein